MGEVAFPACRFACSVCRAKRAGDKQQDLRGCPAPRTWHLAPYMQACGQKPGLRKARMLRDGNGEMLKYFDPCMGLQAGTQLCAVSCTLKKEFGFFPAS